LNIYYVTDNEGFDQSKTFNFNTLII